MQSEHHVVNIWPPVISMVKFFCLTYCLAVTFLIRTFFLSFDFNYVVVFVVVCSQPVWCIVCLDRQLQYTFTERFSKRHPFKNK